ncbi:hypothetical protein ACIPEQ_03010 [Curtobacterium sp. NPDC087080]|uniref:hypothetical protein n=1 Tax=Curtobacterium sp. NPDC087080 TaxID=3363965 RepID=UPI003812AA6C
MDDITSSRTDPALAAAGTTGLRGLSRAGTVLLLAAVLAAFFAVVWLFGVQHDSLDAFVLGVFVLLFALVAAVIGVVFLVVAAADGRRARRTASGPSGR